MDRNSPEFKALQAQWDKKLADSGFKDIEQRDENLKIWDSHFFRVYHRKYGDGLAAREEYYRLAGQFLHSYKFKNPTEKTIWKHHSDGHSVREISQELKKVNIKLGKTAVDVAVRRLAEEMLKELK